MGQLLLGIPPYRKNRELLGEFNWDGFDSRLRKAERGFELLMGSDEDMVRATRMEYS